MDRHGEGAQEVVGKGGVGELEVSLVVELEQRRGVGMLILQVYVVNFGLARCVTAFFTHVHLQTTYNIN